MTAWQDKQPPQSRRQLRLSEQRNGTLDGGVEGELPEEQRVDVGVQDLHAGTVETPVRHSESFARPGWDAPARRSAAHEGQAPASQQPRSRAEASGRRAQHGLPQAAPALPDDTDAVQHGAQTPAAAPDRSSQVPSYGGPSFGVRAAAPAHITGSDALRPRRVEDHAEDQGASRLGDTPSAYRVRDFSPESRRSAFSSTSELSASDWNRAGAAGESANLDYHTQQGPSQHSQPHETRDPRAPLTRSETVDAQPASPSTDAVSPGHAASTRFTLPAGVVLGAVPGSAPPVSASPMAVPVVSTSLSEVPDPGQEAQQPQADHTLTRRELRALRQAAEPDVEGSTAAPVGEQHTDHGATPQAFTAQPEAAQPEAAQPGAAQPEAALPEAEQPVIRRRRAQQSTAESAQVPPPLRAPAESDQQSPRELSEVMAEFDSLMGRDPADAIASTSAVTSDTLEQPGDVQVPGRAVDSESGDLGNVYTVPTGHWSTQSITNDDSELDGVALSRNIAVTGGAVTASHLVISSVPTVNDLLLPFSPTGEIMITGTIDLPASLGSTGAHPARYDHSDVDALLEASDREDSNVDSAPVRAIRAVSTHTSSRGLIGSGKPPRSSRLPMVLAVSTAAVAAVVVALFVAGFMLHMF